MSFRSEDLTSRSDNTSIGSALTGDRTTLDQWLFHGATLFIHVAGDPCWCDYRRQRRCAQSISAGFEFVDADCGCLAYIGSVSDCNDYAVTKRHELLESGLPSKALRLSVVKTASGIGHLVLVVATTKGDLVLDNLTEVIRPWQNTDYHWLKIQSATDSKYWYEIKAPAVGPSVSLADRKVRLANR